MSRQLYNYFIGYQSTSGYSPFLSPRNFYCLRNQHCILAHIVLYCTLQVMDGAPI